ncbi:MAG: SDR family oxidoreductase [Leptospiraceae bacterium]|nr:SDR family oxidoreductase [Leptospiraceae bacterium]
MAIKHKITQATYVVTGASRGIGKAIAHNLAARGADLILISRDKKSLAATAAEIQAKHAGRAVATLSCDLADRKAIEKTCAEIKKKHRALAGIINNAGYARPGYFHELPADEFEKAISTDYLGAVHLTRGLHDLVIKGGLISFTSSVVGFMGVFGYSSYAGAKFALIGFAETLRQELFARGIQISVLCPPDTATPGYETENKTKPYETAALSESAKLMTAEAVAEKYIRGVTKGKFIINCNFESAMLYRLHGIWPSLVFSIMSGMIRKAQKKKSQ